MSTMFDWNDNNRKSRSSGFVENPVVGTNEFGRVSGNDAFGRNGLRDNRPRADYDIIAD